MSGLKLATLAVGAAALLSAPAWAHHSAAMFDRQKTSSVTGTIKLFQFANPHAWLYVTSAEGGVQKEYNIEMTSPNLLGRAGWRPGTLKTGDKVVVRYHPFRDGTTGGQIVDVTLPNGKVMNEQAVN